MMDSGKKSERGGKKGKKAAVEAVALGDANAAPVKSRRGRHKKPKDMPSRPLSAYNLFFAEERERILAAKREGTEQPDFIFPSDAELQQQASTGKKKPPALFQALAKCVGGRWRTLPQDDRKKYEDLAKEEMKRYREKMTTYQEAMVVKSIAESANKEGRSDETESSDGKPPAKKAKTSDSSETRDFKPALLPDAVTRQPPQIQLTLHGIGSPQDTVQGAGKSPRGSALSGTEYATAFSPAAPVPSFHQHSQQQTGANIRHPALAGGMIDPSAGLPFAYQQRYVDPRAFPSASLPFITPSAAQQLPQSLSNVPRPAMAQSQSDMFLQHQAFLHQQQIQRALMAMPPGAGAADLAAFQQQLIHQHGLHMRGAQGMFPAMFLQSAPHFGRGMAPGGFTMDAAQLTAASNGATADAGALGGYPGMTDMYLRSQQQQQQSQNTGTSAPGQQTGPPDAK